MKDYTQDVEEILKHDPKDIIKAMLPFMKWGSGHTAIPAIRAKLSPKWQDNFDAYSFAKTRLKKLIPYVETRLTHFREQGWSPASDEYMAYHKCALCNEEVMDTNGDLSNHFRRCSEFNKILANCESESELCKKLGLS